LPRPWGWGNETGGANRLRCVCGLFVSFAWVFPAPLGEAAGLAFDRRDGGAMGQAVEQGAGQALGAEDGAGFTLLTAIHGYLGSVVLGVPPLAASARARLLSDNVRSAVDICNCKERPRQQRRNRRGPACSAVGETALNGPTAGRPTTLAPLPV